MQKITNSIVIRKIIFFLILIFTLLIIFLFFCIKSIIFSILLLFFLCAVVLSFLNFNIVNVIYVESEIIITKQKILNIIFNTKREITKIPLKFLHHYEIQYGFIPIINFTYIDQKSRQINKKNFYLSFFNKKELLEFDLLLYKIILF